MTVLAVAWALWIVSLAALHQSTGPSRTPPGQAPPRTSLVEWVGAGLRSATGRPSDRRAARRLGATVVVATVAVPIHPVVAAGLAIVVWLWPIGQRHRAARDRADGIVGELPEVIDLLRVAAATGATLFLALELTTDPPRGPVSAVLADVVASTRHGLLLADALDRNASRLGSESASFVRSLLGCERYGTPLGPTLDRLAIEARGNRRRRAETAARRVPIRMLLPLVVCILPAFVLLTLVPTLAGTLESLQL